MTKINKIAQISKKLASAWDRKLVAYSLGPPDIYCLYADEALTGFVAIISEPKIETFDGQKCVCVPYSAWVMIHTLATMSVTPFRIVAQGKGLIAKGFRPHTGLKFPIRNTEMGCTMLIPVEDFTSV